MPTQAAPASHAGPYRRRAIANLLLTLSARARVTPNEAAQIEQAVELICPGLLASIGATPRQPALVQTTPLTLLRYAREWIATSDESATNPLAPAAPRRWTALGAALQAVSRIGAKADDGHVACDYLRAALVEHQHDKLSSWATTPWNTRDQTLALYDCAIAIATRNTAAAA